MLLTDTAALAAVALTVHHPVTIREVGWAAALAALSIVQVEANRHAERMRELAAEGSPYVVLLSAWTFAGLLVLPASLMAALIVVTYVHLWWRIGRTSLPHLWAFSAATILLGSAAGSAIIQAVHPSGPATLLTTWSGIAIVAIVAVVRWGTNSLLGFVALPLMRPSTSWAAAWRTMFGTPADDLVEFAGLSLGVLAAAAIAFGAPLLLALALPIMLAQRGLLLRQFQHAAQYDEATGVLRAELWRQLADKLLERADRHGTTAGYLVVQLDRLPPVLAGQDVLRPVADAIRSQVRGDGDLVCRLPGEVFAVLAFDVPPAGLSPLADRIRSAVRAIRVTVSTPDGPVKVGGVSVSIGGASYPESAPTLSALMLVGDNVLFTARSYGGGRTCVTRVTPAMP